MGNKEIVNIIEKLALKVTDELGYELVDVMYKTHRGHPHVVVFIDKPGGVSLKDCEQTSKLLGELLDIEDPVPSSYMLEVSSPGIERPLKSVKDFQNFQGSNVKLKTYQKINGRKNFVGVLAGLNGKNVVLQTEEGEVQVDFSEIAKANLYFK